MVFTQILQNVELNFCS